MIERRCIARTLGAQIVLCKPLGHLGVGEHTVHEALPHGIPSVGFAGRLVDVSHSITLAEEKLRHRRAHCFSKLDCRPKLGGPFINRALTRSPRSFVSLNVDSVVLDMLCLQAKHVAARRS